MTKLVGILNITPDSFFDGGKYNNTESAIKHLQLLINEGADVIDIGAESTRPNAIPISANEEWKRLENILPQVIDFVKNYNSPFCHSRFRENDKRKGMTTVKKIEISLDSRHYQTIAKALELGIDIINDVSGFASEEMIKLSAESGKKIIVMHNLGVPADKNKIIPEELDVVEELIFWMQNKLNLLLKNGVQKEQIIFDVGIGFGKNSGQSITILKEIDRLRILDLPLYVGHSNKSFLDKILGSESREDKTLHVSSYLAKKGVEYLRVHNIFANKFSIKNGRGDWI